MTSNNMNNGRFVWYEYLAKDAKAAVAFYTDVVGWKTEKFAMGGDYVMWVGIRDRLAVSWLFPKKQQRWASLHTGWRTSRSRTSTTRQRSRRNSEKNSKRARGYSNSRALFDHCRSSRGRHVGLHANSPRWISTTRQRSVSFAGTNS